VSARSERYADVAPCGRCGKDVSLQHDPPCRHGEVACPECGHPAVCLPCSIAAEREMFASGEYDPKADPFVNHEAPASVDRLARDGGYWWEGAWHAVPKMERKP
jgi:hypothetical protein